MLRQIHGSAAGGAGPAAISESVPPPLRGWSAEHPTRTLKQITALVIGLLTAAPAQERDWKRVLTGAGLASAGGYVLYRAGNASCVEEVPPTFGRRVDQSYLAQYNPVASDRDILVPARCRSRRQLAAGAALVAAGALVAVWWSKADVEAGPRGVRLSKTVGWR